MALLGEDGRGYELARKLESQGVWRSWLGDALYSSFIPFLSSPAAWDSFMRPNDSKSRPQISLELRVRALLFDKASVSLFAQPTALSKLNPNYLELHGDDVYFTLENGAQDVDQRHPGAGAGASSTTSKGHSKASIGIGSKFSEQEVDAVSQRLKLEELPETWYNQFFEKYRAIKSYRLMFWDGESEKRTPEHMSTYLKLIENHKRRRVAFVDNNISSLRTNPVMIDGSPADDTPFFPETMYILNCVPDSAVLKTRRLENSQTVPFNGVLDNLPQTMTKSPVMSPIMIERLGIRPEYLSMEQGQARGKNGSQVSRKLLIQEQASQMSQKVVVRLLHNVGFESSSDTSLEVMSQLLSSHINKLGRTLKLLADSYRKQYSATELLKMFLQTSGYSNLGTLVELMKDNSNNVAPQTQQQLLSIQGQMQPQQQQPSVQQSQQMLRQMSPQMQQMNNPQYLAFQQQQHWERMRRRQQQQQQQQQLSTPRPGMNMTMNTNMNMGMDKDRPLVQVKMEAPSDFPLDTNTFTAMNPRHPQLRQQQLAAISTFHAQANNTTFRPMTSLQIPQMHSPTMSMARAPPVKVEGFQELMGGDSSMKHDSEENKLLSPQK